MCVLHLQTVLHLCYTDTDLMPFRKARDAYWTAQDARSLEVGNDEVYPKYYTYLPVNGVQVDAGATNDQRVLVAACGPDGLMHVVRQTTS